MWNDIKEEQPMPGEVVELKVSGELLRFIVGINTVYNVRNNILMRFDEIEIWQYPQEETEES